MLRIGHMLIVTGAETAYFVRSIFTCQAACCCGLGSSGLSLAESVQQRRVLESGKGNVYWSRL